MRSPWDDLWLSFRGVVESMNDTIGAAQAGYVVRVERHANDVFPFRAWASYAPASSPGDERLVLSVDFKRTGSQLEGHVDLARGDGVVLAEDRLGEPFDEESLAVDEAVRATEAVGRFVVTHANLVEAELRRG